MISTSTRANGKAIFAMVATFTAAHRGQLAKLVLSTTQWTNRLALGSTVTLFAATLIGRCAESIGRTFVLADGLAVVDRSFVPFTATVFGLKSVGNLGYNLYDLRQFN